jgi:hypothetical protein
MKLGMCCPESAAREASFEAAASSAWAWGIVGLLRGGADARRVLRDRALVNADRLPLAPGLVVS